MSGFDSMPRSRLLLIAVLFAASITFYTSVWIYFAGWMPAVQLGLEWKAEFGPYATVKRVDPGSPAERARLQINDRILSVNGYPQHVMALAPAIARGQPGDVVMLRVQRAGVPETFDVPLTLAPAAPRRSPNLAQQLALDIISCYPVPFLVVGLLVLFLRLEDRNAWLLALTFAGFICAAPVAFLEGRLPPLLMRFVLSYMILLYGMLPATFYLFFGTFPTSSPIDQRLPWLQKLLLSIGLAVCVPFALMALFTGSSYTAVRVLHAVGDKLALALSAAYLYVGFGLGMLSLMWNGWKAPAPNDRRKSRVILWGTAVGLAPMLVASAIAYSQHKTFYEYPFWFVVTPIIALTLLPLSFAYAVVKHRVLEIPVLLKRSARYFLVQRGFLLLILLAGIGATLLLARELERHFPERNRMAVPAGAALGIFLVWSGTQMESRVTRRLDRAFFRSSYDTRQILLNLAGKTRSATSREQLAQLLLDEIDDALHPSPLAIYFRQRGGDFVTTSDVAESVRRLPKDLPVLRHMEERGQPWEIAATAGDAPALEVLQPLRPECLVPIQGRDGQLLGLAVLGPKLSEESYSREDRQLLDSVANQAGVALENFDLAESMAERLEAEHRASQEMDIARQVQSKLLPQKTPTLRTLDYAGVCIQARAVGGDYYDFLDLGEGRVGFVLADVAGKGISAALLMANLQAHLRSQSAIVSHDFSQTLETVNRLFYESTEPSNYATLFIGVYEDTTRRLRYINCGHNPPVIVRANEVVRLCATATVLGLFDKWQCEVDEARLMPGDILAICTDGVLEAANAAGDEFGENGLVAALRAGRGKPAQELLECVVAEVQRFANGGQADDLTLLIAKAHE